MNVVKLMFLPTVFNGLFDNLRKKRSFHLCLGKEIHLCKDESCYKTANEKTTLDATAPADGEKASESSLDTSTVDVQRSGPHYHCPVCNVLRNRRSPLINHLWRCIEQPRNSKALTDNWKKATILLEKDLENVPHPRDVEGLKVS